MPERTTHSSVTFLHDFPSMAWMECNQLALTQSSPSRRPSTIYPLSLIAASPLPLSCPLWTSPTRQRQVVTIDPQDLEAAQKRDAEQGTFFWRLGHGHSQPRQSRVGSQLLLKTRLVPVRTPGPSPLDRQLSWCSSLWKKACRQHQRATGFGRARQQHSDTPRWDLPNSKLGGEPGASLRQR